MFRFYSWIYSLSPKKIFSIIFMDSVFQMLQEKKPNISCWTHVLGLPLPPVWLATLCPLSFPGPRWWENPRPEQKPLPSLRALQLCWILPHFSVYLPSLLKLCLRVGNSMQPCFPSAQEPALGRLSAARGRGEITLPASFTPDCSDTTGCFQNNVFQSAFPRTVRWNDSQESVSWLDNFEKWHKPYSLQRCIFSNT